MQLQTQFANREALSAYLRTEFPAAAERDAHISFIRGGRSAVMALVERIQPERYASSRNMLDGSVTHLSPYIRHGIVTLAEIRRFVLQETSADKAQKLLQELAWRDYFQRVYQQLGNDIWQDIEPGKTGVHYYDAVLPEDIKNGETGLACIDAFSQELLVNGYLHNHARMWTASYVIHHRRIRWQAGAYWFLQHLLDGDPASNNLSWQWVASTFAAKPYFFNQENLARYTSHSYCATCPLLHKGCPFEGSYEEVEQRIIPGNVAAQESERATQPTRLQQRLINKDHASSKVKDNHHATARQNTLVWLHEDLLQQNGPAIMAHPQAEKHFIFDEEAIEQAGWTLKRIQFLFETLLEIPEVHIHKGMPAAILLEHAQRQEDVSIATTAPVDPRLKDVIGQLQSSMEVEVYQPEPYVAREHIRDLRRFSRYWQEVQRDIMRP